MKALHTDRGSGSGTSVSPMLLVNIFMFYTRRYDEAAQGIDVSMSYFDPYAPTIFLYPFLVPAVMRRWLSYADGPSYVFFSQRSTSFAFESSYFLRITIWCNSRHNY